MDDCRKTLVEILQAALAGVNGRLRVAGHLRQHPAAGPVRVVAIGKAASSMAEGAWQTLGNRMQKLLLITKPGHADHFWTDMPDVEVIIAGHPVPDEGSLAAGRALLDFIDASPADVDLLFLISGGASALVEALPEGWDLEALRELNRSLLAAGLDIVAMNRIRKRVSLLKGGKLLAYLKGRPAKGLFISDVPGDDPAVIGSGLLVADPQAAEPLDIESLPEPIRERLSTLLVLPPAPTDKIPLSVIACLDDARRAAAERGRALGLQVCEHAEFLQGDAAEVGAALAAQLRDGGQGLHVWGGETTVVLPPNPGAGGRNQHLALAAAQVLEGLSGLCLLSAGTDGTDGPGCDAGAVVDGGSIGRGKLSGLDPHLCLAAADSGRFLEASGDLVNTGPTGTNVMDLVLGLVTVES